ncbi:hypothetical protein L211DRAFT_856557 [Terfezia boudieri ATCC MYA-4762]|uniref:Uncharacterized protein n=1 Tax=Terfezia boudieri ATCC MYA-4762 TaxID=1051890 RepID=A0A3N4M7E8_9PEZI|nr:hypothetical protein L211DRAFT_856557 [Terfezia boudieri ATCC MYA-4762]
MEISERTAHIWLNKLGFRWKDVRKGVYVDSHERDDVGKDGNIIPVYLPLPLGKKEKILATYDDAYPLQKKGQGKGIMVSEFMTPRYRLAVPRYIYAEDLPRHNWWTGEKMVEYVVNITIPIFERAYPGYQAIFLFDNTSNHAVFAPDALVVIDMNLGPALCRKLKGIKQVLLERGLWRNSMHLDYKPKCGMQTGEPQASQRGYLQEVIEARRHYEIFYPKFHCKLNFIEFFWAAVKRYAHENCEYSL